MLEEIASGCCAVLHKSTTEPIKEIRKEVLDVAQKNGSEVFEYIDLGEIQKLTDTTPAKLAENDYLEMSASEAESDDEGKT